MTTLFLNAYRDRTGQINYTFDMQSILPPDMTTLEAAKDDLFDQLCCGDVTFECTLSSDGINHTPIMSAYAAHLSLIITKAKELGLKPEKFTRHSLPEAVDRVREAKDQLRKKGQDQ